MPSAMLRLMRGLTLCLLWVLALLAACTDEPAPPPLPSLPRAQVAKPAAVEPAPPRAPATATPVDASLPSLPSLHPRQPAQKLPEPAGSVRAERADQAQRLTDPLLGVWRCQFDDYPPMRCLIRKKGGGLWLEKTQGSQRIRGMLTPRADELLFTGEFFCPMGACTSSARAELHKLNEGWAGTLQHDQDGTPMQTPVVLTR